MTRLAEGSYYFVYLTCFVKWYQGRYSMGNSARQLILDNQKNGAIPSFETLARMFHEWLTATTDMAVLPGVLGCRTLRRTVQVRLGSNLAVPRDGCPVANPSSWSRHSNS